MDKILVRTAESIWKSAAREAALVAAGEAAERATNWVADKLKESIESDEENTDE